MVTLECRFIDDSIDQKEEDNAIYSDNPGNYVSEVKIFFPVSSLQWLWHKLNTNCILNPSEERCPYHLCIFLSRWTLYHLLWGKGVKKNNFNFQISFYKLRVVIPVTRNNFLKSILNFPPRWEVTLINTSHDNAFTISTSSIFVVSDIKVLNKFLKTVTAHHRNKSINVCLTVWILTFIDLCALM